MSNKNESEKEAAYPEVAARFADLLKDLDLNPRQFSKQIGTSAQNVSNYLLGYALPGGGILKQIAERWKYINVNWLLTGAGEMFLDKKAREPFVPGAEQGLLGSEFVPSGALASIYGANFGQDEDDKQPQAETPKDAKGFIKSLLAEIDSLKKIISNQDQVISEQREALKESRENAQFLRAQLVAKAEGNHEAPGTDAAAPVASLTEVHMQCSRCTGTESGIVAMYPAPQQQLRMAS